MVTTYLTRQLPQQPGQILPTNQAIPSIMIIHKILGPHQLPLTILIDLIVGHPLALYAGPLFHLGFPFIEVVGADEVVFVNAKEEITLFVVMVQLLWGESEGHCEDG